MPKDLRMSTPSQATANKNRKIKIMTENYWKIQKTRLKMKKEYRSETGKTLTISKSPEEWLKILLKITKMLKEQKIQNTRHDILYTMKKEQRSETGNATTFSNWLQKQATFRHYKLSSGIILIY